MIMTKAVREMEYQQQGIRRIKQVTTISNVKILFENCSSDSGDFMLGT